MSDEGKRNQVSFTLDLSDEAVLEAAAVDAAAGLLLGAVAALIEQGEPPTKALAFASYVILSEKFGREFVVEEFGISPRTERYWRSRIRSMIEQMPDDPPESLQTLAQRGAVAAYVQKGK